MRSAATPIPLAARLAWTLALAAPLALAPAGLRAADESAAPHSPSRAALHLQIRGDDGEKVDLDLSSGWLGALIQTATIDCDGNADGDARRMMKSLREQGEGGVWKERDRDGDQVLARRAKGMLKIQTDGEEGDRAEVEMPWELAECLMMGVKPAGDLGGRIARGEAKFRIHVEDGDGSTVRFAVE